MVQKNVTFRSYECLGSNKAVTITAKHENYVDAKFQTLLRP